METEEHIEDEELNKFITSLGPHKRWYQFGFRSPVVLWKRFESQHQWLHPFREIRYGMQRWRRGWSDRDTWNLDYYLTGVMIDSISHLKANTHGYPSEFASGDHGAELWEYTLEKIIHGLECGRKIQDDIHPGPQLDSAMEQHEQAFRLLGKYWFDLWD